MALAFLTHNISALGGVILFEVSSGCPGMGWHSFPLNQVLGTLHEFIVGGRLSPLGHPDEAISELYYVST